MRWGERQRGGWGTALAVSLVAGLAGIISAPGTLGIYFSGTGQLTLFLPGLVASETGQRRWVAALACVGGVSLAWLLGAGLGSFGQRLIAVLILLAYGGCLGALTIGLIRLRFPALLAAGATALSGILWLSWPVWLSPHLHGDTGESVAAWLVPAHPLFALNATFFPQVGQWTEQAAVMYQLSDLGQHLRYRPPSHGGWSILVHALIGAAIFGLSCWRTTSTTETVDHPPLLQPRN